jgi:hypothetical protein
MQRRLPLLGCLVGLVLLTGLVVAAGGSQAEQGPVHTVADPRERLAAQPASWVGRTVVVRAIAGPCPWWIAGARLEYCAGQPLVLYGTATDAPADPLPLLRPAPQPLLTALRRVPVWPRFTPARFRVRLFALPTCSHGACYAALLLGVAPLTPKGR